MRIFFFAVWAALAGGLIPIMALLNARLARDFGRQDLAPLILFLVGLLATLVVCTSFSKSIPAPKLLLRASPIDFAGGLIMANYIFMVTMLVPRIGISTVILFAVTAQILSSAAIDHFGLLGAKPRLLDAPRAAGIVMVLVGLALTQLVSFDNPATSFQKK